MYNLEEADASPHLAAPRTGRALAAAVKPYAEEVRSKSWWVLWSTLIITAGLMTIAGAAPWWPVSLIASVVGGLSLVRLFIVYHDYIHGSILRGSTLAKVVMYGFGLFMMTPPNSWRRYHNRHHNNVGIIDGPEEGGFPTMTTRSWREASRGKRFVYRFSRHPLIMLTAGLTIFFFSVTVMPFIRAPRIHWDSVVSVLAFSASVAALSFFFGVDVAFFAILLPYAVGAATGAYIFYVQHNFEGMEILPREEWTLEQAALRSSGYLKTGPIMEWFTGAIGYHHIHHLNRLIPFYRLREAMDAVPELQEGIVSTLHPRDIWRSFQLQLWDEELKRMVTLREAARG